MYFIDTDGAYCFTLGVDRCDPSEHVINKIRIIKVGNDSVSFSETILCSASNGMIFHHHRLICQDSSDKTLINAAMEKYCSELQNLPPIVQPQEASPSSSITSPSSSTAPLSRSPLPETRASRRPTPYPAPVSLVRSELSRPAASMPLGRLQLSRPSASISSASHSRSAASMPVGRLQPSRSAPASSMGSASHSGAAAFMPVGRLQSLAPSSSMDSASHLNVPTSAMSSETTERPALRQAPFFHAPQTMPSMRVKPSRSARTERRSSLLATSSVIPQGELDNSRPGPSTDPTSTLGMQPIMPSREEPALNLGLPLAPKITRKPIPEKIKRDVIAFFSKPDYLNDTVYSVYKDFKIAHETGSIQLEFLPSRAAVEGIMKEAGYITHVPSSGPHIRAMNYITLPLNLQVPQQQQQAPQEEVPQEEAPQEEAPQD